jgi:hypothetical protein
VLRLRSNRLLLSVLALFSSGILLSSCGFARMIVPLQSPRPTPTRPNQPLPPTQPPTAIPSTQTPILLPTATLAGPDLPGEAASSTPETKPPAQAATAPAVVFEPPPPTDTPALPTITPLPSPTLDLTAVYGPKLTPNTRATSFAVIQTITALAASPTYPPTDTPRPRRTPIIIGSGPDDAATVTRPRGVRVLNASRQVSVGGPAALSIRTDPGATCALQVIRPLPGNANALEPIDGSARLSADRDGGVAWIWRIDADEAPGPLSLIIDCGAAGKQQVDFTVLGND